MMLLGWFFELSEGCMDMYMLYKTVALVKKCIVSLLFMSLGFALWFV